MTPEQLEGFLYHLQRDVECPQLHSYFQEALGIRIGDGLTFPYNYNCGEYEKNMIKLSGFFHDLSEYLKVKAQK